MHLHRGCRRLFSSAPTHLQKFTAQCACAHQKQALCLQLRLHTSTKDGHLCVIAAALHSNKRSHGIALEAATWPQRSLSGLHRPRSKKLIRLGITFGATSAAGSGSCSGSASTASK